MSMIEQTLVGRAFITPHTHANDVWVLVQTGVIGALVGEEVSERRSRTPAVGMAGSSIATRRGPHDSAPSSALNDADDRHHWAHASLDSGDDSRSAQLRGADVRLPDERPRQRAHLRPALSCCFIF
jgi:hypothetical protein